MKAETEKPHDQENHHYRPKHIRLLLAHRERPTAEFFSAPHSCFSGIHSARATSYGSGFRRSRLSNNAHVTSSIAGRASKKKYMVAR
jgi:hypothetical protein